MEDKFDVIVIGSGFGASPPALNLSRNGQKVLVIEKGKNIDPTIDFKETQNISYLKSFYKSYPGNGLGINVVEALGGGSGFFLGICLRAPSFIFKKRSSRNKFLWPSEINRSGLDKYYQRAEKMLGVAQVSEKDVSKNGQIFSLMMKNLGYSADRTRLALKNCIHCGYCISGCRYNAKQSLLLNYLPLAKEAGAFIRTDTSVEYIKESRDLEYKYEVLTKETGSNNRRTKFSAKNIVIAAGTVGSAKLLLNSKKYLPKLSTEIGKHVKANIFFKKLGLMPSSFPDGELYRGYGLPGYVSYEFLKSHNILIIPYKTLPVQMLAKVRLNVKGKNGEKVFWGEEHVDLMKKLRKKLMVISATAYLEEEASLRLEGNKNVIIDMPITPELRKYSSKINRLLHGLLERNGCDMVDTENINWDGSPYKDLQFNSTHSVGSCNMAESPENGVVSHSGRIFNYPGLYITDGSIIPSSLIVPPSLTILALAERASDHIIKNLNQKS